MMSLKQCIWLALSLLLAIVLLAMLVWMVVKGEYKLWAMWLAVLCAGAICLRNYALEWRRLKDLREGGR